MSSAVKNFHGIYAPMQRIQEDSNLRMLLVICGLIAIPSMVLVVLLTGWAQYVFAVVAAINVAVPVLAFLASLNPPRQVPEEDYSYSDAPQVMVEDATRSLDEQGPVAKISDKV